MRCATPRCHSLLNLLSTALQRRRGLAGMFELGNVCPDCGTALTAPSGPQRCENCWRIVQLTRRLPGGEHVALNRWGRLPPHLQRIDDVVRALALARWMGAAG